MKNNLKKLRDGLFVGLVVFMTFLVVGVIAIASKGEDKDFSSIVMVGGEETKFVMPLDSTEVIKDFSADRLQFNSTLKQWEAHKAVDLKAEVGTSVKAIADGKVLSIDSTHLKGTTIVIEHLGGFVSSYSSLNADVNVKVGDSVKAGDEIGKVDASAKGEALDEVHLHFELLKDGKKVDPNLYFTFGQK